MTFPRSLAALLPIVLGGLLTAAGCGGQATGSSATPSPCDDDCGPGACEVGGQRYDDGTTGIPAGDGCNTCSCSAGNLACTDVACPVDPRSCEYGGVMRPHGASFPSTDGCNTCSCDDGQVACTLLACVDGCQDSSQCGAGEVCLFPTGLCGGAGTCESAPMACDDNYAPVCGCDGATYSNACEAASNRVSVATEGACMIPCYDHGTCAAGEYCAEPPGQCFVFTPAPSAARPAGPPVPGAGGSSGGAALPAPSGVCQEKPEACGEIYAPVCGCDNVTYDNACLAASAGVSVLREGGC